MKITKYISHRIIFIFLALIIGFAYRQWIFHWGILTYGDWYYFHKATLETIRLSFFHMWVSDFSLGATNIGAGQAPSYALYGAFAYIFGWGYAVSLRIIHLLPIVIFTPLLSYLLLWNLTKNRIASLVGALVYSFNTYFLILDAGTVTIMAAYAFLPGVFLFFYKSIEYFDVGYGLGGALLLGISGAYEPRIFYIILWILFLYFIFVFFSLLKKSKKFLIKLVLYSSITPILGLLLNFYWLFGLSHTHSLTSNVLFNRALFGNEFLNILYAITLYHPFWSGGLPAIFVNQKIPFFVWLVPMGAFMGLFLNRKNLTIVFFGILAIIGILLTKQSGYPFGGFYMWLYSYLPGFDAFREASKFYGIIAFSYSVLIGSLISWLWDREWKRCSERSLSILVTIFFIVLFIFNLRPLIVGAIGTLFVERHVPHDYTRVENKIVSDNGYYRTLWVPIYSRWGTLTDLHPELGLIDLYNSVWSAYAPYSIYDSKYSQGKLLSMFMENNNFMHLAQNASIKYIFVPIEDKANNDDFFVYYGEPRQYYINALDKISWLKRVNMGTKEIAVYENPTYRPHIYTTSEKETITKDVPYQKIKYAFINPTEYTLTLSHVKNPLYVNFSEAYNANWKMHVGNFNWWSVLINKNYFLPASWHFQNDATLNSFYVEPKAICSSSYKVRNVYNVNGGGCMKNSDGTYTIHATLYFIPQSYMDFGLIVSAATLVGILGYLGFMGVNFVRRKYAKEN